MKTYQIGLAFCTEPAIFNCGWWYLVGLEEHLPDVFMHHAKELSQPLVYVRVELPQIASSSLARKNPTEEHNLDNVDKPDFLARHVLDACLKSGQFFR